MSKKTIFEGSYNPRSYEKRLRNALKNGKPLHEGLFQGLRREEVTQILTKNNYDYPTELLDGYDILYGNGSLAMTADKEHVIKFLI